MEERKTCRDCGIEKSLSEFYFSKRTKKSGEEYLHYRPDCIECVKKLSKKYYEENREYRIIDQRERNHLPHMKKLRKNWNKKATQNGYYSEYFKNNKYKFRQYRDSHQNHDITKDEWNSCKEYFNNSCAYCGLHVNDHYIGWNGELRKTDLHREHVAHDGTNDISNCIPACRDCNVNKWQYDMEEWYYSQSFFDINKLQRIHNWLNGDYKIAMEENK